MSLHVARIMRNLPNPVKWQSFFKNDLPLLMDFCEPEIEPFQWDPKTLQWPVKGKEKPNSRGGSPFADYEKKEIGAILIPP